MPSLAELVDLVIGVDTHKHTHTAAIVDAGTGGTIAEATVATAEGGYQELSCWTGLTRTARGERGRWKAPAATARASRDSSRLPQARARYWAFVLVQALRPRDSGH